MNTEIPSFGLSGSVALVTGAGRGIGRAAALALAHAGSDVALGLRNADDHADLAEEIEKVGRRVVRLQMDVLDLAQARAAVDRAVRELGGIDILVNNAGGGGVDDMAIDVTEEQFDHTIGWNVKSAFFISQHVARHMIQRGKGGRIVNVSSQAALVALPGEPLYCLSKAAVSHMTRCMAIEWGEYGITVNAVAPTFIETPGTENALSNKDFRDDTIERIAALHRLGRPREVSGGIVFLASPAASLITGHVLVIDGGWTVR